MIAVIHDCHGVVQILNDLSQFRHGPGIQISHQFFAGQHSLDIEGGGQAVELSIHSVGLQRTAEKVVQRNGLILFKEGRNICQSTLGNILILMAGGETDNVRAVAGDHIPVKLLGSQGIILGGVIHAVIDEGDPIGLIAAVKVDDRIPQNVVQINGTQSENGSLGDLLHRSFGQDTQLVFRHTVIAVIGHQYHHLVGTAGHNAVEAAAVDVGIQPGQHFGCHTGVHIQRIEVGAVIDEQGISVTGIEHHVSGFGEAGDVQRLRQCAILYPACHHAAVFIIVEAGNHSTVSGGGYILDPLSIQFDGVFRIAIGTKEENLIVRSNYQISLCVLRHSLRIEIIQPFGDLRQIQFQQNVAGHIQFLGKILALRFLIDHIFGVEIILNIDFLHRRNRNSHG